MHESDRHSAILMSNLAFCLTEAFGQLNNNQKYIGRYEFPAGCRR
jgi:hypothetical protein